MLDSVVFRDFGSFREATLPLASLTVLIGGDASGKTNAIEGLALLSWMARGRRLGDLQLGLRERELALRGTPAQLARHGDIRRGFGFRATLDGRFDLSLRLGVTDGRLRLDDEELWDTQLESGFPLYRVQGRPHPRSQDVEVAYNNFARGGRKPTITAFDQQLVFTQLTTPARFGPRHVLSRQRIPSACRSTQQALVSVLLLDPDPRAMRGYAFDVEQPLASDGGNLSATLHDVCARQQRSADVLEFVRWLPEQDIDGIDFLHGPRGELMLQLVETFGQGQHRTDAALLSDGTLRVLAVAAALLSVEEGSLVIVEDIDNGVHPSRVEGLLARIRAVADRRRLRVLVTTHNPATLDALPTGVLRDVVACWRDPDEGDSRLARLSDLARWTDVAARGPLGQLATSGQLDRLLKEPTRRSRDPGWLERLLAGEAPP